MSAIWNSMPRSREGKVIKSSQKRLQKDDKPSCKLVSKELQYGYSKGGKPELMKSFSSCFQRYRAQVLLLRLFSFAVVSMCHTGGVSLRVQKSPSGTWTGFFASVPLRSGAKRGGQQRDPARESMTLCRFGGQFDCFSRTDSSKVCCRWGLYSGAEYGKVYTINFDGSDMNVFVVERLCCVKRKGV